MIWPFQVRWDYFHHTVDSARKRGIKIMYQSESEGTKEQWKKVLDEYGTDHLFFTGFRELNTEEELKTVNDRINMFQELDPLSVFYIYGWEFTCLDWTAKDYERF